LGFKPLSSISAITFTFLPPIFKEGAGSTVQPGYNDIGLHGTSFIESPCGIH
jgi:hypothetical protein